ncbi:MAG: 6,7-dimethyl-8-ribityllumazine synthase [Actinomycetota bacterium]|jgi:6,7-dimethyl-8-ribityllumazine synthase|nr:6,7-dimethyl-8-ribityllumazine synthase [Actinomycetota bacterium]
MAASDLVALPAGARAAVASRVGRVVDESATLATGIRVAFACAVFNGGITDRLLTGALAELETRGAALADVTVAWVPGAYELPLAARALAAAGADAVVALGAVIRGDTGHYDFVAGECAAGLQRVQLDTGVPVVFGVLTTDTVDQALVRSAPDDTNKGREAAATAVEMVGVLSTLAKGGA